MTYYKCDVCGHLYYTEADELACGNYHAALLGSIEVGATVKFRVSLGSDRDGGYSADMTGVVIERRDDPHCPKALVDTGDGERRWIDVYAVERKSRVERPQQAHYITRSWP